VFLLHDTTLKPGETLVPVMFYVDPDIVNVPELKDLNDHSILHDVPGRKSKPVASSAIEGSSNKVQIPKQISGVDMADAHAKPQHDYHRRPEPVALPPGSISALVTAVGGVAWMQYIKGGDFPSSAATLPIRGCSSSAWRSSSTPCLPGGRTPSRKRMRGTRVVSLHLHYGMIMFIASEVMFFVAWFWAYFDASLFPSEVRITRTAFTGGVWPPKVSKCSIPSICRYTTPSFCLSGTTVTWAHHAPAWRPQGLINGLVLTVGRACCSPWCRPTSTYTRHSASRIHLRRNFFMTGFHGFHVIIGTIFLAVCLIRAMKGDFTPKQHFGFGPLPGTGTSSTWSGCFCSARSMSGDRPARSKAAHILS
jgi:cytochrome c oxidase subunit 3